MEHAQVNQSLEAPPYLGLHKEQNKHKENLSLTNKRGWSLRMSHKGLCTLWSNSLGAVLPGHQLNLTLWSTFLLLLKLGLTAQ